MVVIVIVCFTVALGVLALLLIGKQRDWWPR